MAETEEEYVTETRESGIEFLDTDIDLAETAEGRHFRTEEPVTIVVGDLVGHNVTVESEYFVVASAEGDRELGPMETMQLSEEDIEEDDDIYEGDDGELRMEFNEASVLISNADGDLTNDGVPARVEGGDEEDALDEFEEQYL